VLDNRLADKDKTSKALSRREGSHRILSLAAAVVRQVLKDAVRLSMKVLCSDLKGVFREALDSKTHYNQNFGRLMNVPNGSG
jgi:hypothetical protein